MINFFYLGGFLCLALFITLGFFTLKRYRRHQQALPEDDAEINDRILDDLENPHGPRNVGINLLEL